MFPFVGAYLRSLSSNFYRLHYGKKSKVNDIRPGADPVNERIKSQLVAKHGQDFKSKVVARLGASILFQMMPIIPLSILLPCRDQFTEGHTSPQVGMYRVIEIAIVFSGLYHLQWYKHGRHPCHTCCLQVNHHHHHCHHHHCNQ